MDSKLKSKILAPIRETSSDYDELENLLIEEFRKALYQPIMDELAVFINPTDKKLKNSMSSDDALLDAINKGKIRFYRGAFHGKFNAKISRAIRKYGGEFDRKTKTYKIHRSRLPLDTRMAISSSIDTFTRAEEKIKERVAQMLPEEIADTIKTKDFFDKALWKINKKVEKTLEGISVAPKLTKEMHEIISQDYTNNLDLSIKGWLDKEVVELRKIVEDSTFQGIRYEHLAKQIQERYGVGKRKAKFLARQETNLLMAKFKETRYSDAGVNEYIWTCVVGSPGHEVRPMHKKLDGTLQRWDDPPVVDMNGNKKNPGEDFNCRCFPRPVVRF